MNQSLKVTEKLSERRRHPRVALGVPVRVHLAGEELPRTIELVDVSIGGGAFRMMGKLPVLGQRAAFGFVTPDSAMCAASGLVVRVGRDGFAVKLEKANGPFRSFVADISGPHLFS
jgi:hypothetical protein